MKILLQFVFPSACLRPLGKEISPRRRRSGPGFHSLRFHAPVVAQQFPKIFVP